MMNLNELEQFTAFAKYGTLSRTAKVLNISQPTITRTMQHVEEEFGVTLFNRGKNKITLNETGENGKVKTVWNIRKERSEEIL